MNLSDVMTAAEAAKLWNLGPATVRQSCTGYKGAPPRFTIEEARKSENTWLVTRKGMERLFGPMPEK